jgi:flavin-dependent dehydrogenase
MHDLAIIGAGPAGATLARLLGDRYRMLLVDKRHGRLRRALLEQMIEVLPRP